MAAINDVLKNNKAYVFESIFFLIITASFIGLLFFLQSLIQNFQNTQNTITITQNTYTANDGQAKAISKSNILKDNFLDALPTQNTIINWVQQTEQMAKTAGVSQTLAFAGGQLTKDSIVFQQTGSSPSIAVNIVVKGKYNGILSYIDLLDHSYYYTRINSISFTATKTGTTGTGSGTTVTPTQTSSSSSGTGQSIVMANITLDLFVKDITSQPK